MIYFSVSKAVLLIGFLLEDSEVAHKVRNLVLGIDELDDILEPINQKEQYNMSEFSEKPEQEEYAYQMPYVEPVVVAVVEPVIVEEPKQEVKSNEIVVVQNNQAVTTSLQVAETFGKRHDNVLQDIKNFTTENSGVKDMFHESTYTNERGREYPMFYMNRDGFTLLAMGFTGKKAMKFKIQYINQFNQMEEQLKSQVPAVASYMIDNPIERAKQWIEEQQEKMVLAETVEKQVVVIEEQAEVIEV